MDAAGFVLAGGQSTRMGADKALVEFRGQPLIAHMLGILRGAGLPVSIAGQRANVTSFAPVIRDLDTGQGPLEGVCRAFAVTAVTWLIFVPVDLPLLPADLVRALLNHARVTGRAVTLASLNGFAQTFPCVLNRAAEPALSDELKAGRRGCFSAFRCAAHNLGQPLSVIPAELLAQAGQVRRQDGLPPSRWFFNVNSPADLERATTFRTGFIARTDHIA